MMPAAFPSSIGQPLEAAAFRGELYMPEQPRAALPAVVILNSSAGVCDVRERFYARSLAGHGVAALVVDSFGPRGIVETMSDQSRILDQELERDAYAAYDFLAADTRIDPRRIAVMGVSKGGLATINTGLLARRTWFGRPERDFAARVALVPPAHMQQRDAHTDGRPLLILLAGLDDYTGTTQVLEFVARMRSAGCSGITVEIYPDAHHAWERTGPPLWMPDVENYSHCRLLVEDDASLTDTQDGRRLTVEEFFKRRESYLRRGGHAGGGAQAFKDKVVSDILRFLSAQADFGVNAYL